MFGKRLKTIRDEMGLTQTDLAKALEVSQKTISNYEKEERSPDPKTIIKLANFFDVSTDYLLGQTQCKKINQENKKDIEEIIHDLIHYLKKSEDLLLKDKPATDDALEELISAIRVGLEMAKRKV